MMPEWLQNAMHELLELHIAHHMQRGLHRDEALIIGVEEIKQQIRGSRGDLIKLLVDDAVLQAHYAREHVNMH
jgi:hypothetical protein